MSILVYSFVFVVPKPLDGDDDCRWSLSRRKECAYQLYSSPGQRPVNGKGNIQTLVDSEPLRDKESPDQGFGEGESPFLSAMHFDEIGFQNLSTVLPWFYWF